MELVRCKDHRLKVEQTEAKNVPWREGQPTRQSGYGLSGQAESVR